MLNEHLPAYRQAKQTHTTQLFWPKFEAVWFNANPMVPTAAELAAHNGDLRKALANMDVVDRRKVHVTVCINCINTHRSD